MPAVYVIPKAYEWAMRRAILEEQSRIASGFYDDPLMADPFEGDVTVQIVELPSASEVTEGSDVRAVLADRARREQQDDSEDSSASLAAEPRRIPSAATPFTQER